MTVHFYICRKFPEVAKWFYSIPEASICMEKKILEDSGFSGNFHDSAFLISS